MKNRTPIGATRSRVLFVVAGVALAGILAIALLGLLYTGGASAHPGNTCDPDPGHGRPGCHVDDTTTTVPAAPSTSTTVVTPSSLMTTTTVPSKGPALPSDPNAPRTYTDQNNCLSCHGDPNLADLMTKQRPDGTSVAMYVDRSRLTTSVHRFQDCTECHTANPHDTNSPLTKLSLAEKCGSCHQYEYGQYINSVHGAPQKDGNSDPATCTDCHSDNASPHSIVRVFDPAASTYPKNIAQTCAKCHDDPKLMGKYGIVEKVYDSYMRSFHGKKISLAGNVAIQQLNTATCVNCHGAHNISLTSNPDSPVAGMENLAKTCEQCHTGAGVEFAKGFLGHKEADMSHVPQVFFGEKFFFVFTRVVLAGGVILVVAPFGRKIVDRVKPPKKRAQSQDNNADEGPEPVQEPEQEREQEE